MTETRQIYLVDDDEAIRHSASFMLRHAGFAVKTFADGLAFLDEVTPDDNGCVLLDVRMPGLDGIGVLKRMGDRGIRLPVIVLTGHGDVPVAVDAMKCGASDFLEKPYEKQALISSIDMAFKRIDDGADIQQRTQQAQAKIRGLTDRERDVLKRLVDGLTNKAIANDLDISARTVEIHRANLMGKLEAESLSAALKIAFIAGIGNQTN